MVAEPSHWRSHYRGTAAELRWLRHHSYADRIRYYWPQKPAIEVVAELLRQIDAGRPPRYLLRDYFDAASIERTESLVTQTGGIARALVLASIQAALLPYFSLPTSR
jgi:tagatose-1,6-bisphosphate aldolase non-catalytic subunit AgaZ/GatZ